MKNKIFDFVKDRGPIISKDVYKYFNLNSTFAGAYLSELVQDKKVLYSQFKVGTSPLYYTPEQKDKIIMLFEHLDPKDQDSFNLLKQKKVLRDTRLPLLNRVSFRKIKDFAIPLQVLIEGKKEIFWKWYMLNNEEASSYIKKILDNKTAKNINQGNNSNMSKSQEIENNTVSNISSNNNYNSSTSLSNTKEAKVKPEDKSSNESSIELQKQKLIQIKTLLDNQKKELEDDKIKFQQKSIEEDEKLKIKYEEEYTKLKNEQKLLIETQQKRIEDLESHSKNNLDSSGSLEILKNKNTELKDTHHLEIEKITKNHNLNLKTIKSEHTRVITELKENMNNNNNTNDDNINSNLSDIKSLLEEKEKVIEELKEKLEDLELTNTTDNQSSVNDLEQQQQLEPKNIAEDDDIFVIQLNKYFIDKNIEVTNYNIIKKESDIEFHLKIPSVIGLTEYYCRAKNKKKCNEGDLSTAFVSGVIKKLPVLFISTGDITKKSEKMLESEFKNTLIYKRLDNGS